MATNPTQAAADWAQRTAASGEKIRRGIQGVTTAPGQAAARQKGAYVQGVTTQADKWASRTASVSLGEWQQAAIEKGVPRIAQGATAAQGKMESFMAQFLPHVEQARQTLPPRGSLDQNIARSVEMMRRTAAFKRR